MTTTSASQGYRTINPATGELLKSFDNATDQQIADALDASQAAYEQWSRKSVAERAAVVKRISELLAERSKDIAALITTEMGKSLGAAVGEVRYGAQIFGYYADEAEELLADQRIKQFSGQEAFIQRLPLGPLLGIMPWNFPVYQVARFVAPNLMLGNTILLKHAEINPQVAQLLEELFTEAGLPEGVYQNVFATHDQISTIIADPRVQGVSLTGSERAGAAVAEQAGRHLKKVVLELGGSDPYIVLDAEDPAEAARTAWATRMYNMGQACNSNKRMIVSADIHDAFVAELVSLAEAMKPGEAADEDPTVFTPLSSRGAAEGLAEQVERARQQGATVHVGGTVTDEAGARFAPAVITGVTSEMDAYREELFGPVAVVYKVESADEALALANDSQYGLGGAVFSQDEAQAERIARQLEVGMANVNTPAGEGAEIPFGGVKRSGFGRELGPLGMDEFVNKQMYFVQD